MLAETFQEDNLDIKLYSLHFQIICPIYEKISHMSARLLSLILPRKHQHGYCHYCIKKQM